MPEKPSRLSGRIFHFANGNKHDGLGLRAKARCPQNNAVTYGNFVPEKD